MINPELIGKYKIIKQLRKSGFATTYLCSDNDKKYIIKHILLSKTDKKYIELINREADTLKKINHEQIPKFIESIIKENNDDIEVYLVQEYIEANTFKEMIDYGKHFTEEEVKDIALQLSRVLEYLHNFLPQIIHRDIKPSNILISETGKVYLIDFGAVKEKLTYTKFSESGISTIIGTQGYMPIEQFEGKAIPASDIYSLGLTLIYLLSGLEPLQHNRDGLNFDFGNKLNISDKFKSILKKMIEPDWKKRYINITQVKSELLSLERAKLKPVKNKAKTDNIELDEDENILWACKSEVINLFQKHNKVLLTCFSIAVILIFTKAIIVSFAIFLCLCIIIFKSLLIKRSDTSYVLTNKHLIINNPKEDYMVKFNFQEIKSLQIEKIEYSNGSGDLFFFANELNKDGKKVSSFQLYGIKEIKKFSNILNKTIHAN